MYNKTEKEFYCSMSYQLIALDLDFTLLTAKKEITPKTRQAIARAAGAGVHVVLASGRTFPGMRFVLNDLGHRDYTISCGGAIVTDPDGKQVYACLVPPQTAKKLIRFIAEVGAYFQVFVGDDFYYSKWSPRTADYEANVKFCGILDPKILEWDDVQACKILIIDTQERVEELRLRINELFPDVQTVYSQSEYMEMLNADVSKGKALAYIARLLHLKPEHIIAIGDSEIDIPMIEYAGLGIAMGNARQTLLDAADYVTLSCEEDGVALAIEKFVFGEEK